MHNITVYQASNKPCEARGTGLNTPRWVIMPVWSHPWGQSITPYRHRCSITTKTWAFSQFISQILQENSSLKSGSNTKMSPPQNWANFTPFPEGMSDGKFSVVKLIFYITDPAKKYFKMQTPKSYQTSKCKISDLSELENAKLLVLSKLQNAKVPVLFKGFITW